MDERQRAQLVEGKGLVGSANQGGRRQVTLLEREVWDELTDTLGSDLDAVARRANFLVSGVRLRDSRGKILVVGDTRIRIYGETKPCRQMEEALPGLKQLMVPDWKGGAFGKVVVGGEVSVGDSIYWE